VYLLRIIARAKPILNSQFSILNSLKLPIFVLEFLVENVMRKIILALVLLTGTGLMLDAQSVITLKTGEEIQATVLEIGDSDIQYKRFSNPSGPTYSVSKSEVFSITTYKNDEALPEMPVVTDKSKFRRGYLGLALGAWADFDSGFLTGLNFGYRFGRHVGITTSAFLNLTSSGGDTEVGTAGVLVGPLFTFANLYKTVEFDIRPTVGLFTEEDVIVGIGGSIRWNCSNRISLSGNIDYYSVSAVGISTGINIRF
jgi:hypothetical protein